MKNKYYLYFFLFPIFFACQKNKNTLIDGNLREYVDRFYAEAEIRGIELSRDNLEVIFRDLSEESVCGLGNSRYEGTDLRKVEISPEPFCWGGRSEWSRENLIFHELGHAVLARPHINDLLPNGLPKDMMCGSGTCDNFSVYGQYTLGKRTYYLDKLFKGFTSIPDWGKVKSKESILFQDDFERKSKSGELVISDVVYLENFEKRQLVNESTNSKSIKLSAKEQLDNPVTATWEININQPLIQEGVGLKLEVNVSADKLIGEGAAIYLETFSGHPEFPDLSSSSSTRRINRIEGTHALKPYVLEIPYFPSEVQQIKIGLRLLPKTSGSVYFDDLTLKILDN